MNHMMGTDHKSLSPFCRLGADDAVHLSHLLRQTDGILIQRHLTGLDLAHVQNIVDETQQMPAGKLYFLNIGMQLVRSIRLMLHQVRNAHDGIHGRPNVMGHIGQEITLGLCRFLCHFHGSSQLLIDPLQLGIVPTLHFQRCPLLHAHQPENRRRTENHKQHCKNQNHADGGIHQRHRIGRHISGRNEENQRPLGIFHPIQRIVNLRIVDHCIGIGDILHFQFLSCQVKRTAVQILHSFQNMIDIKPFQ